MLPVAIITFLYPAFGAIVVPVLALMNYRHGCTKEMKWLFISLVFVMAFKTSVSNCEVDFNSPFSSLNGILIKSMSLNPSIRSPFVTG